MSKTCPGCGETKPLDEFSKLKTARDGRQIRCRACQRAYQVSNRERIAERKRAYRQANRERLAGRQRAWAKANPDKKRALFHRRRARKGFTVPQRWRLSESDPLACYWCGRGLLGANPQIDHVMPIVLGGPAEPSNEVMACAACNRSKYQKHPLVWIGELL